MPHVVVEYTDNLDTEGGISALLQLLARKMRDSGGVFPVGGIRVRAIRLTEYVVADGEGDYAFVHVTVKIGEGRSPEFKRAFFDEMFGLIQAHFALLMERRPLALSMYVEVPDKDYSYKANTIHRRLASGSRP